MVVVHLFKYMIVFVLLNQNTHFSTWVTYQDHTETHHSTVHNEPIRDENSPVQQPMVTENNSQPIINEKNLLLQPIKSEECYAAGPQLPIRGRRKGFRLRHKLKIRPIKSELHKDEAISEPVRSQIICNIIPTTMDCEEMEEDSYNKSPPKQEEERFGGDLTEFVIFEGKIFYYLI